MTLSRITLERVLWLALVAILAIMYLRGCNPEPSTVVVKPVLQPTTQKTDKKGTAYTEISGSLYTEKQMKALSDSFRRVLGKGKVTSIIETVTTIDTFLQHDTLLVDVNTGEIYAADSSPYHKVSYVGNFKLHTGGFQLSFRPDTMTYVTTVNNHWFKRDELVTNVYNSNPFFRPSVGTSYSFKPRRVIGTFGPMLGYGLAGSGKLEPYIGIGFTLNTLPIKSR